MVEELVPVHKVFLLVFCLLGIFIPLLVASYGSGYQAGFGDRWEENKPTKKVTLFQKMKPIKIITVLIIWGFGFELLWKLFGGQIMSIIRFFH